MNKISILLLALVGLTAADCAIADCGASGTLAGTRKAFDNGQRLERTGDLAGAFWAYIAAQEPMCEANPVEAPAARRAAALALPLGKSAEQQGDYEKAFSLYDEGGQYAAADRALMSLVRARPDDPGAFTRVEQRVATLTKSYSGAPKLLDEAIDYQQAIAVDGNRASAAPIKAQAGKLGDEAIAKQRYGLAAEYYDVADQDAKAQAALDQQRKVAMSKMQPQIDRMKQQAEQMKAQYSDPEKVKAMQEQAREMRKSLQQQQQANAKSNAKKADDLEKELGL